MASAGRVAMRAVGMAALIMTAVALAYAPAALAQTMGEYGLMVNHSASSAAAMHRLAPSAMPPMRINQAGSTRTYEIPDSAAREGRAEDTDTTHTNRKDPNDDSNGADWDQVK